MSQSEKSEKAPEASNEKFFTGPLLLIYLTVFIDLIGFGMVIPILPFYANTAPFNATPFEIGLLLGIYSIMQFIFSPLLGRLSDKYGRRPILFISILGSAVGYFVIGAAGTLMLVFLGRVIGGITGGNIATAQAYIADVTSRENRAKGMGIFGAMFGLGFILGPALAGVLSKYGVSLPFYVAAVLALANAIAVLLILPETVKRGEAAPASGGRIADMLAALGKRDFGAINLVYFLLVTAFSIMTYAFVLFTAYRYGYNAEQNGYLFAYVGVMAVIGQGVIFGTLASRFHESKLAIIGCLLMASSFFAFPFLGPNSGGLALLLGICTVLSIGNALAAPSLTSLASKLSSDDEQGSMLGIMQSGASLARAIGPFIGGLLLNNAFNAIDDSSVARTFWAAAGIMLLAMVAALYLSKLLGERRELHRTAA